MTKRHPLFYGVLFLIFLLAGLTKPKRETVLFFCAKVLVSFLESFYNDEVNPNATFPEILLANFVTLSLIVGMAVIVFSNRNFDKRSNQLFLLYLLIVFVLDFADMGDYYLSEGNTLNQFRYFTSCLGYVLRPAAIVTILAVFSRREKPNPYLWIPLGVLAALVFTSPWSHWVFSFREENNFVRGPIGYLPHVVSGLYFVLLMYQIVRKSRSIGFGEIAILVFIMTICSFAVVMESETEIKFLSPGCLVVSCTVYYIYLDLDIYKRDALTGLWNRRSLYADAERLVRASFVMVLLDLNGLKGINDTGGHQAGDQALCLLADTCLRLAPRKFRLYRSGGDELVVLGKGAKKEEASAYVAKVKKALEEKGIMASFGIASSEGKLSFDEVFKTADLAMYDDKRNYPHRPEAPRE